MIILIIFTIITAIQGYVVGKEIGINSVNHITKIVGPLLFNIFFIGIIYLGIAWGTSSTDCGDYNQGPCYTSSPGEHPLLLTNMAGLFLLAGFSIGIIVGILFPNIITNLKKDN